MTLGDWIGGPDDDTGDEGDTGDDEGDTGDDEGDNGGNQDRKMAKIKRPSLPS